MAFKTPAQVAQEKVNRGEIPWRKDDYFASPHGGRPPSTAAVREATARYCAAERAAMLQRPLSRDEMIRFNDFDERCFASFGGG